MIKPTIHLNGTSASDLVEQYRAAHEAVEAAIKALGNATPNGRDYYPQGNSAIGIALDAHRVRIAAMEIVSQEMLELAMHCQEFVK